MNNSDLQKSSDSRILYLDYLRVLATLAVMLLHIASQKWNVVETDSTEWLVFNAYNSLVRWCIPMFLMISGALFLKKEEISIKTLFSKYILRLFIAFIVWSIIYFLFSHKTLFYPILSLINPGTTDRFINVINKSYNYHLWFIPMMIGIYICMPISKQIVKNDKITRYFLVIAFIFWSLLPQLLTLIQDFGNNVSIGIANAIYSKISGLNLFLVMNYIPYFILGYVLSKTKFQKKIRLLIYALGICGFIFTFCISLIYAIQTGTPTDHYFSHQGVNTALEAIALFELFKNISFKNGKLYLLVSKLSKYSFGAYLVHALVIEHTTRHGLTTLSFNPILSVPIITIAIFVTSFIISALLNRISGINKYLV